MNGLKESYMKLTMSGLPIINSANADKISFCVEIQKSFCHKMTVFPSSFFGYTYATLCLKRLGLTS